MTVNKMKTANGVTPNNNNKQKKSFTAYQWLILVLLALINFAAANVISLMAPFFPAEAEKKGASPTEYGFVFGVFQLVIFIVSPIYGKYMVVIGPKFLLNAGIFTLSVCCILFGMLDKIHDRNTFVCYALIIRMTQGLGHAGFITASLTLIAKEFPDSVPTTFSLVQTFYGIGILCGPTLGSVLYEIGGFITPFVSVGSCLFVTACITFFVMPSYENEKRNVEERHDFYRILKIPSIIVSVFTTLCGTCSLGFLATNLEPHLRQFNLKPSLVGLIFIVGSFAYSLSSPFWGRIVIKLSFRQTKVLCGIGALCICTAYILIGPAPFIPLDATLWLCIIALAIHGFGVSGELVCSFLGNLKEAKEHGYPDSLSTFGLMSSMWASSTALGGFLGPSLGGVLLDYVGFRMGTMFIISLHGFLAVLNISYGYHLMKQHNFNIKHNVCTTSETTPLINKSTDGDTV